MVYIRYNHRTSIEWTSLGKETYTVNKSGTIFTLLSDEVLEGIDACMRFGNQNWFIVSLFSHHMSLKQFS